MDQSFILMLSNLLHLQNHLDPTSSIFTSTSDSSSTSLNSSSPIPLLFFAIASVLSYATTLKPGPNTPKLKPKPSKPKPTHNKKPKKAPTPPPALVPAPTNESSDLSVSAFRALSTEHIWAMEPPVRDTQWRASYGLSYPVFASLVDTLKPHILQSNLSLPSDYAVAMVLARLAHGHSVKEMAMQYSLEPYLVSKITNMVTRLLATKVYCEYVKMPVGSRLVQIVHAFREMTGLNNVCGAIDGSHVKLSRVPEGKGVDCGVYECRYGYPAVLLQLVADHRKIIWDCCVKAPGGTDDATHFRDSVLYGRLMGGDVLKDSVVNVKGHHVRPFIVGDWCYPLMSFLQTPFTKDGSGTKEQNEFDEKLMKGRGLVKEAISVLKGRWKILQDLNVGVNHAPQTIVACCVLHNICQINGEPEPTSWKDPEENGVEPKVIENEQSFFNLGESLRQAMCDDLQEKQQEVR